MSDNSAINNTDIAARVTRIVSEVTHVPVGEIGMDTDLRVKLNVDSIQGLQIVAGVEQSFGIRVPDEEIDFYSSVRSIVAMVESRTAN